MLKWLKKINRPFYYYEIPEQPHKINIIDVAEQLLFIQSQEIPSRYERAHKDRITCDKLQKLCYYAQVWHITLSNKPLFDEEFEAWMSGPANYEIYKKYHKYGWRDICSHIEKTEYIETLGYNVIKSTWDKIAVDNSILFSQNQVDFLKELWNKYGCYDDATLRNFARNQSPWKDARVGLNEFNHGGGKIISKESMKKYYKQFIGKNLKRQ